MYSSLFTNPYATEDKASHQRGKGSPRSIKPKKIIYDKPKSKSTLAARQSLDKVPTVFDLVRQGILSSLEKTLNPTDVNATNSANETLLHIAATHGHLEIIDYLISKGVKLEVKDNKGRTPLHRAAEKAKVLIEKGANLKDKAPNLSSPLHLAVEAGAFSIAQMLLQKGVDPNITAQGNQTPLHVAAIYTRGALVDLLIEGGAKIDAVTTNLFTPLHMASDKGHTDVALKLLQHKTPLHLAADMGNPAMVELLLNFKADPNVTDKEKKSPLHFATLGGHFYAVKALLAKKSRVASKDMDGCTPMHYAASSGNMEILKELWVAGDNKNINDKNIWRKTLLHLVAEHGHSNLIDFLLNNGSSINALDNNKDTPLHCACKAGHFDSVRALLNWSAGDKANLQAVNSLKKTPLQVAESSVTEHQAQIVNLLKKKMLLIR
uniref:Uncharacterized protein n=1 Tax=Laticauda laticaudata TaxID=8630 RepID=A0A8C5WQ05_LATLA